jgi:hypothetical protein
MANPEAPCDDRFQVTLASVAEGETKMLGVQFLVDEQGNKTAVVIDLKKNAQLWEDFYDRALARSRQREPREALEAVKKRVSRRKRRSDG